MFSVVILQRHTVYLFMHFEFLLMPVDPLFHVTLWALLFRVLTWGLPLSVRSASGVQCWSCSQPSSSPSRSALAGQKHCLIRHWGRWPPPIFFFSAKQASLSAPHLLWWDAQASLQQPFFGFFFFFLLRFSVGVLDFQSANVTLLSICVLIVVFFFSRL